jgi:hypothetical protein
MLYKKALRNNLAGQPNWTPERADQFVDLLKEMRNSVPPMELRALKLPREKEELRHPDME